MEDLLEGKESNSPEINPAVVVHDELVLLSGTGVEGETGSIQQSSRRGFNQFVHQYLKNRQPLVL